MGQLIFVLEQHDKQHEQHERQAVRAARAAPPGFGQRPHYSMSQQQEAYAGGAASYHQRGQLAPPSAYAYASGHPMGPALGYGAPRAALPTACAYGMGGMPGMAGGGPVTLATPVASAVSPGGGAYGSAYAESVSPAGPAFAMARQGSLPVGSAQPWSGQVAPGFGGDAPSPPFLTPLLPI